jgi:hypothetical protein
MNGYDTQRGLFVAIVLGLVISLGLVAYQECSRDSTEQTP